MSIHPLIVWGYPSLINACSLSQGQSSVVREYEEAVLSEGGTRTCSTCTLLRSSRESQEIARVFFRMKDAGGLTIHQQCIYQYGIELCVRAPNDNYTALRCMSIMLSLVFRRSHGGAMIQNS